MTSGREVLQERLCGRMTLVLHSNDRVDRHDIVAHMYRHMPDAADIRQQIDMPADEEVHIADYSIGYR
jgi:hypothetical protein